MKVFLILFSVVAFIAVSAIIVLRRVLQVFKCLENDCFYDSSLGDEV